MYLQRADAVEDHIVQRQARQLAARDREASEPASARDEELQPLPAARSVRHDEAAVVRIDVERGWIEHASRLLAHLDDLLRLTAVLDRVDRVTPSIEDVIRSLVSLLKSDRRQECAGDVCRQSAD